MSAVNPQTETVPPDRRPLRVVKPEENKPQSNGTLPCEVKREIENLRRLTQTIQDRLHALSRV